LALTTSDVHPHVSEREWCVSYAPQKLGDKLHDEARSGRRRHVVCISQAAVQPVKLLALRLAMPLVGISRSKRRIAGNVIFYEMSWRPKWKRSCGAG
jgi:hypothetical protein